MAARNNEPGIDPFVISRIFAVPRALMWKVWTEPKHLMRWWGPKGVKMLSAKVDLRVGGTFHYGMRTPDGKDIWGKFLYREIVPPERVVFDVAFSDEKGGITRHPFNSDWPQRTLSTVNFADENGKTRVTVSWVPLDPTDIERKTFEEGRPLMQQGWAGTLDQLESYLADKGTNAS